VVGEVTKIDGGSSGCASVFPDLGQPIDEALELFIISSSASHAYTHQKPTLSTHSWPVSPPFSINERFMTRESSFHLHGCCQLFLRLDLETNFLANPGGIDSGQWNST
jgi:hypothetical protein